MQKNLSSRTTTQLSKDRVLNESGWSVELYFLSCIVRRVWKRIRAA